MDWGGRVCVTWRTWRTWPVVIEVGLRRVGEKDQGRDKERARQKVDKRGKREKRFLFPQV